MMCWLLPELLNVVPEPPLLPECCGCETAGRVCSMEHTSAPR